MRRIVFSIVFFRRWSPRLNDVKHLLAECAQELLGVGRADAPDHARRKVFLDAFDRRGL
jgi:hypothetical protein